MAALRFFIIGGCLTALFDILDKGFVQFLLDLHVGPELLIAEGTEIVIGALIAWLLKLVMSLIDGPAFRGEV